MANAPQPNQAFVYDELPDNSIRLLEMSTQKDDSNRITFELRTYHLNKAPPFNALSYVWGQSLQQHTVPCGSGRGAPGASSASQLTITSNLFHALPFLHAASRRPIWIDAICINQGSHEEKARVVPMMGEYYGQAAEVLVWLGPSSHGSDLAMDTLRWLWFPRQREALQRTLCPPPPHDDDDMTRGVLAPSQLASLLSALLRNGVPPLITDPARDAARLGVPGPDSALWSALRALYQRDWFFRVWTFQEIALATTATVLCGDRALPWTAFQQLGDRLSDTQLLWLGHGTSTGGPATSFSPLRDLRNHRPHQQDAGSFWLSLRGARDRSCRFKEDRIFGMLALAPPDLRARIPVAYPDADDVDQEDHYIQTYRAATIAFLHTIPLELVLVAAASSSSSSSSSSGGGTPKAMPSWCADWSRQPISHTAPARFPLDPAHAALQHWSVDPTDPNVLHVRGQQTDVIACVIDDYAYHWPHGVSGVNGPADRMLQWLDRCQDLTRRTLLRGEDEAAVTNALWQTLLAYTPTHSNNNNKNKNPFNFPPDPVRGLAAHCRRLAESRDTVPLAQTALSPADLEALGPFLAYVGVLWPGKVFFATTGGTVGLADRGVAAGNVVCSFFGVCKHFVLGDKVARHDNGGEGGDRGGWQRLQSVAYVYGMMDDVEAALRARDGDRPLRDRARMFKLC